MDNYICHHEIPADDPVRASKFYSGVFNWKITESDMGEFGKYYSFSTGDKGSGGGICKRTPEFNVSCNYIAVDDIPAYCERVGEAGGTVIMEKTAIPGHGFIAICSDTEGNVFGLWSKS